MAVTLSATVVEQLAIKCILDKRQDPLPVDGLVHQFVFSRAEIAQQRETIRELLQQLPIAFRHSDGGGTSFLNAPFDSKGEQWGEHRNAEQLLCLGIAAGYARELKMLPAAMLPGGMPYFQINLEGYADAPGPAAA